MELREPAPLSDGGRRRIEVLDALGLLDEGSAEVLFPGEPDDRFVCRSDLERRDARGKVMPTREQASVLKAQVVTRLLGPHADLPALTKFGCGSTRAWKHCASWGPIPQISHLIIG